MARAKPVVPDRVRIINHSWRVAVVPQLENSDGDWLYGQTRTRETRILLNANASLSQQQDTLTHEILHAVMADISFPLNAGEEEALIRQITPGILSAIRENPALIKFLTAVVDG